VKTTKVSECLIDSDDEDDDGSANENSFMETLEIDFTNIEHILQISNRWIAQVSGYNHKITQIQKYNWVSNTQLEQCIQRLNELEISKNAYYKEELFIEDNPELFGRSLRGFVDCVDDNNIYIFKCVANIEKVHIIQAALSFFLHKSQLFNTETYRYYIYNILTGEKIEIDTSMENLRSMVLYLFENKFIIKKTQLDDISFDNKMRETLTKICPQMV
tara:strand:- start:4364 stop:5014 length:651 start_codon:yes stop_codon:yes gene_type:complete